MGASRSRSVFGWWGSLLTVCGALLALAPAVAQGSVFGQFQGSSGRTGYEFGAGVVPPLTNAFKFNTGTLNDYIPIDGGRAYAFAFAGGAYSGPDSVKQVDAVSLSTGRLAWSQTLGAQNPVDEEMVVDNGRVFTAVAGQESPGSAIGAVILSAIDENTGALIWRDTLDEQVFPSSMIDSGGVIYLMGSGEGGTVWAINESTGARRWTDLTFDAAPITLAGNTLVIAGTEAAACALSAQTGQLLWSLDEYCPGNAGNGLASYDGTSAWGEDPGGGGPGYVYNPSNGNIVKEFHGYAPAFGYHEAVHAIVNSTGALQIQAFNPSSMSSLWTFNEPSGVTNPMGSMPLLADGYVFAEGSHAQVWALNACTGAQVWTGKAGSNAPYEGADPLPGLSAGDGYLVAPTAIAFTAFKGSGSPHGSAPVCSG